MNEKWAYVAATTVGPSVALAVARPRWAAPQKGQPHGEWQPELLSLDRKDREAAVAWLSSTAGYPSTVIGGSLRGAVLLDISEAGGGDLLLRAIQREAGRAVGLQRLRIYPLDVTQRDVERGPRVVSRRAVLAPLLDAIERDTLPTIPGPHAKEFVDQYDALSRKPDAIGGNEDLVRAVALVVWAIDLEGRLDAAGRAKELA